MAKYISKKIKGVRVTEKIEKKEGRPLFPRPAVFRDKTKYDRKQEKKKLREEDWER